MLGSCSQVPELICTPKAFGFPTEIPGVVPKAENGAGSEEPVVGKAGGRQRPGPPRAPGGRGGSAGRRGSTTASGLKPSILPHVQNENQECDLLLLQ